MDLSNSKSVGLVIFFITFVAIIIYVYGNKKRSVRFESYRDIPFLDDEVDELHQQTHKKNTSKESGK